MSKSTKWSSNKLTSSIYKKPRLAWASKPGEKALMPWLKAFSKSRAPTTRSSLAPSGKSTTGTGRVAVLGRLPVALRLAQSVQVAALLAGSQP